MRTIPFILRKEFLQIFRNRAMLPIIFVMPVIQLLVLANAATFEVKNTKVHLLDADHSQVSRRVADALEASGYFTIQHRSSSEARAEEDLLRRRVSMIVSIPKGFERDLMTGGVARVQVNVNAEDGAAAGVVQSYATSIISEVGRGIAADLEGGTGTLRNAGIVAVPRYWYNPDLDYETYMVPGLLVVLVTMIGAFLSGMNIVKEKETGTIEQLNVTPLRKYEFIIGKLLPFWIIGLVELAFGLVIAWLVFRIPMLGSLWLVFASAAVYLLVVLGIGLWVSTLTETQQQAMFITWFIVVLFILLSGLFTPLDSMPEWAQWLAQANPIAHFISIMRAVLVRGAGWAAIQTHVAALAVYAVVVLGLSVRQYRKITA